MPPVKVFVFVGCIAFILLVGFIFFYEPESTKELPCETGLHTHEGVPIHCG